MAAESTETNNPSSTPQNEGAEAIDVGALKARLNELASSLESIESEMEAVQSQLAEIEGEPVDSYEHDPLAQARAEANRAKDDYQRALADLQNFQRRSVENERRARDAGRAGALETMVSVLDTFDMAMRMDPATTPASAILQGVEMIRGEMLRVLGPLGFTAITPTRGAEPDPVRHETVSVADDGEVEPGTIVEVIQPGYQLGERVLRAAKVIVRASEESEEAVDADL